MVDRNVLVCFEPTLLLQNFTRATSKGFVSPKMRVQSVTRLTPPPQEGTRLVGKKAASLDEQTGVRATAFAVNTLQKEQSRKGILWSY